MDDLPDINDPLWLSPLTDAQLEDIARIEARHQEWRRKEAVEVLVKLRQKVGNAFVALDLVVLDPVCDNCASQIIESSPVNIVRVWPELADGRLRLYDRGDHSLYFFEDEVSEAPGYAIQCHLCDDSITGVNDPLDVIHVLPVPYSEHFGLAEAGPKRARGKGVRRWLAELYGETCFQCKQPLTPEDVTLDHIVARAKGGQSVPANLQVLCNKCNQQKKDDDVVTLELALDFPLRPAPSDSFEGLVW